MALGKLRTLVGRLVVIGALALTLGAGSIAMNQASDVSAAPQMSCADALKIARAWITHGRLMAAYGEYDLAMVAFDFAHTYAVDYC